MAAAAVTLSGAPGRQSDGATFEGRAERAAAVYAAEGEREAGEDGAPDDGDAGNPRLDGPPPPEPAPDHSGRGEPAAPSASAAGHSLGVPESFSAALPASETARHSGPSQVPAH